MIRSRPIRVEHLLAEKERAAREMQAVISCGEEILHRAHRLAESIQVHVRQALDAAAENQGSSNSARVSRL